MRPTRRIELRGKRFRSEKSERGENVRQGFARVGVFRNAFDLRAVLHVWFRVHESSVLERPRSFCAYNLGRLRQAFDEFSLSVHAFGWRASWLDWCRDWRWLPINDDAGFVRFVLDYSASRRRVLSVQTKNVSGGIMDRDGARRFLARVLGTLRRVWW